MTTRALEELDGGLGSCQAGEDPLHGLSPAQPGPGRTGLEVPTGVLAGGSPRP